MPMYRKNPNTFRVTPPVEARRYDPESGASAATEVAAWCGGTEVAEGCRLPPTSGANVIATKSAHIIKHGNGTFTWCESQVFDATYVPA